MKKVLIADDHEIVRRGITMIIQSLPGQYQVIEASTCSQVLQAFTNEQLDFAILDMALSDANISSILEQVMDKKGEASLLVYSMNAEHIYAPRFFSKGFRGFVSKQASISELEKAIKTVFRGEVYISAELQETLLDPSRQMQLKNPIDALSDRELEVSEYLAIGMGVKEIAQKMNLDMTTVSTYKRRAFDKLGVQSSVELKEKLMIYKS
ncbi:MAG: response regulator transcription factor [Chitinophagaceae bacterium]|nr:response regulator transcription factor [Chitinophagaceae bacterium]